MPRSAAETLEVLRALGATRLRTVRFRANRSTIWSLTQGGRTLNLHRAFSMAPRPILRHLSVVAAEALKPTERFERARAAVANWEPLLADLRQIRRESRRLARAPRRDRGVGPCCATPAQRVYLRRLYRYLNDTRFGGRLPVSIPLRLSNRMRSRLGQVVHTSRNGRRTIVEIALNVDLMLPGNGRIRLDTLLHEMAHAAAVLFDGDDGHGEAWRWWATRAGCEGRACTDAPIRRRPRRSRTVTRVPPLPLGARVAWAA